MWYGGLIKYTHGLCCDRTGHEIKNQQKSKHVYGI